MNKLFAFDEYNYNGGNVGLYTRYITFEISDNNRLSSAIWRQEFRIEFQGIL